MFQLTGLTAEQKSIAQAIHCLNTLDEVEEFIKTLSNANQTFARTFVSLTIVEAIDKEVIFSDLSAAKKLINMVK